MSTCCYEQLSFVSEVTSMCAGTRGVFWNSVPSNTKCHPSILNSRQMAPKPWLIVHLRERSLTIGGRAGKFWGRDAIFWAPIWGGLKFSEPAWGEGYNFLRAFGRCARTNWVLCYQNIKHCLKYDGRASNINRITYSKMNHTVKEHSDWLEMRSDFTWNSLQFALLWNGFENNARELWITRLRTENSTQ